MKVSSSLKVIGMIVSMSALVACSSGSGASYTSPDMGSAAKSTEKKTNVDNSSDQQQSEIPADTQQTEDVLPQTVVPATVTPEQPVITEQTIQERYPNWVDPSPEALASPKNAKIYNYTEEGIVSINGQRLASTVPPGKAAVVPKLYDDIGNNGMYRVQVQMESGRTSTAQFDPTDVDMGAWRASVKDTGGSLVVEQNAGGGGGGNAPGNDLENFN
jgi:hypothetical protein